MIPHKPVKFVHIVLISFFYIGSSPLFENDHYRYIWEGKVVSHGLSPYEYSPSSKELNVISYKNRSSISYKKLTSIYPPLSLAFFSLVSTFDYKYALIALQIISCIFTLALIWYLGIYNNKYFYLIIPFLFKEYIQSIHIDLIAAVILVLLAKYPLIKLMGSGLIKQTSILIIPFELIRSIKEKKFHKLLYLSLVFTALIACYLTISFSPTKDLSGSVTFAKYWVWNSFVHQTLSLFFASLPARLIALVTFVLTYVYLLVRSYHNQDLRDRYISNSYILILILTPVLHPWYFIWPLIFNKTNKYIYYAIFTSFLAYMPYSSMDLSLLLYPACFIQTYFLYKSFKNNLKSEEIQDEITNCTNDILCKLDTSR